MPFKIVHKEVLAPGIKLMKFYAPLISKKARPGQFVILRVDEKGERIPLTLFDWNTEEGTITIIFREVGVSTYKLGHLEVGDYVEDILGPLGKESVGGYFGTVVVVGGGVGIAPLYPRARQLKMSGNLVIGIIGAKTADLIILEKEMREVCDRMYICTDDGTRGYRGFVTDKLKDLLEFGLRPNLVLAIGPAIMMKKVSEITKEYGIRTIVSLNPIIVDGTGMCGGCRVMVGGEIKFACVDGPEFDGHLVDFDTLIKRLNSYREEEKLALQRYLKKIGEIAYVEKSES
ncbi:MAG: sulfide/dihydroorotate dehydrogenase-like FAD/NAD-binding protein [Candidatus Asgardarchaeia archaeon]